MANVRPPPTPMTMADYARRRGVTPQAVSQAVRRGKLGKAVARVDGRAVIVDPDLADREWRITPGIAHAPVAAVAPPVDDYSTSRARREAAQARKEEALAELAEIQVAERRGELVSAAEARATVVDIFTAVKTKLLGVVSRVRQRLPHLSAADVAVVDDFVREALEELADGDME